MALQFNPPNLPNLGQSPAAAGITALGQGIASFPLLWQQYKQMRMEQDLKNKELEFKTRQFNTQYGTNPTAPSITSETPGTQINLLGTERYKLLHPESTSQPGQVPYSFEGMLTDKVRRGKMTMEEAFTQYREKLFPKVVSDPLGNQNVLTPEGPKRIFSSEATDTPENALIRLRQAAPKLADTFDKILDDALPQNNQYLKENVEAAGAASKVETVLKQENPSEVGLASLGFHFARMSGSNSQLSDREKEVFEEPLSLMSKVVNKGYRLVAGDLSPQMKEDLLKLSAVLEKRSRVQVDKLLNVQKKRAKSALGRFYNPNIESTFPTADDLVVGYEDIGQMNSNIQPAAGGQAGSSTGPVEVKSQADYNALPSGATYTSNGKTYRKK